MKTLLKFSYLLLFFIAYSLNSNCQIKVFNNNYVGINCSTTPASRFVINTTGSAPWQAYIYSPSISTTGGALASYCETGTGSSTFNISHIAITVTGSANYLMGIKAMAYSNTPLTQGRTYGIYAQAGNGITGFNYSVYGYLSGTNYGAAVFGAVNGYGDVALTDQYAGYFRGKVKCENIIWATQFIPTSDEKFKTNIISLEETESITKLLEINPVKYNLKQLEITQKSADSTIVRKYFTESDELFTKTKYGLIAQELQKIYPDLVCKDGDGNLGVDYMGLVPVLIKVVQSQQKKIDDLGEKISLLAKEVEMLKQK
jgi:hypothetical protein